VNDLIVIAVIAILMGILSIIIPDIFIRGYGNLKAKGQARLRFANRVFGVLIVVCGIAIIVCELT